MEADRMVNSLVARKDLDTEMTVVRNEYERGENSPIRGAAQAHCRASPTTGTTTATRPSATVRDIENVDIENLQAFYRTYYQPDNAVLLVAGKFDAAKSAAAGQQVLRRDSEAHARQLPKLWTVEPDAGWRAQFRRAPHWRRASRGTGLQGAFGAASGCRRR